ETSRVPSLIFDEVDVGVGGATAEVVGQLLRQLGENTQVICVTHLPQVAAQGHHHYRVSKLGLHSEGQETRAQTRIQRLEDREKVGEIARMLGGINMTDQSLAHAEEMFRLGQQSGS
ncbi:MAG: DNA repair protein RecN, partial [Gammaproteobacteria bacterium]|nr:DNA repair protein RecN [Gammaproteobacteria bacterium]